MSPEEVIERLEHAARLLAVDVLAGTLVPGRGRCFEPTVRISDELYETRPVCAIGHLLSWAYGDPPSNGREQTHKHFRQSFRHCLWQVAPNLTPTQIRGLSRLVEGEELKKIERANDGVFVADTERPLRLNVGLSALADLCSSIRTKVLPLVDTEAF